MSKRRTDSYLVSEALPQRQRVHKLMEKIDGLKETSAHLEKFVEKIKQKSGTFDDLLELVFDDAIKNLEDARIYRCTKTANFTLRDATFDNFDFSYPKKIDRSLINELTSFRFVDEHKNVLIVGPLGVGKSHIACALGREAIQKGIDTRCMTLGSIVKEITDAINQKRGTDERVRSIVKTKLLILDDVEDTEKLGNFTNEATDFLYTVLRKRCESNDSATILTFNESFKGWDKIFGSAERAKKLIDRILDRYCLLRIEGNSYRLRDAQANIDSRRITDTIGEVIVPPAILSV